VMQIRKKRWSRSVRWRSSDLCLRARGRAVAGFASAAIGTSSEDLAGEDLVKEAPEVERREWSGGIWGIWSAGQSVAEVGGIWPGGGG
jgi:hypothetical protein